MPPSESAPKVQPTEASETAQHKPSALLSLRTALILLLAALAAVVGGGLTWLSRHDPSDSALVAFAGFGAALKFFDWLIG